MQEDLWSKQTLDHVLGQGVCVCGGGRNSLRNGSWYMSHLFTLTQGAGDSPKLQSQSTAPSVFSLSREEGRRRRRG